MTASGFKGKTAIVTGAASGIGFEVTRMLLEGGAWVLAADIDPVDAPAGTEAMLVDVSDESSVMAMIAKAVDARGRLDIICNNAGIASTVSVEDCSVEEWDRVFAVNARGVFLGCKHAVPQMLAQGGGAIVNTASVAGMVGFVDRAAYCASKAAVIGLTKQIALQYAARGIRCNAVCPGTVDSPWVERLLDKSSDARTAREALIARQPMGRLGTPQEVAAAICFLAAADSAYITGSTLVIDGGILAG